MFLFLLLLLFWFSLHRSSELAMDALAAMKCVVKIHGCLCMHCFYVSTKTLFFSLHGANTSIREKKNTSIRDVWILSNSNLWSL